MKINPYLLFLPFFFVCGCVRTDKAVPSIEAPEAFQETTANGSSTVTVNLNRWWEQFNDPKLSALIAQGLGSNYDVRIAKEKILERRAYYRLEWANLWPEIDATALAERSRRSKNSFGSSSFTVASTSFETASPEIISTNFTGPIVQSFYQLGFDATWELDFFGKQRNIKKAAYHEISASIDALHAIQVSISAEIAQVYGEIRALEERIQIAERYIKFCEELLRLTQTRFESGLVNGSDLEEMRIILHRQQQTLLPLQTGLKQARYALNVLLGKAPEGTENPLLSPAPIPNASEMIPVGLPSELLRRRPDIKHAEEELSSAKARLSASKADMFPSFSLVGSYGVESSTVGQLFKYGSQAWSVGPVMFWPLIDFGRIRSNIRAHNARQNQAMLQYEQAVVDAFNDVEGTLAAYFKEQELLRIRGLEIAFHRKKLELAQSRFQGGLSPLSHVLEEARELAYSEDVRAQSAYSLFFNLIAVYKALGGGWECSTSP